MKIDEYSVFLNSWFLEIEKTGIDVTNLPLDHLGYSASSSEEYDEIKLEFLTAGKLFRPFVGYQQYQSAGFPQTENCFGQRNRVEI